MIIKKSALMNKNRKWEYLLLLCKSNKIYQYLSKNKDLAFFNPSFFLIGLTFKQITYLVKYLVIAKVFSCKYIEGLRFWCVINYEIS